MLSFDGCASTTITSVWSDEHYKQTPIQSILVIGVAENMHNRNIFESAVVAELEKNGVKAMASAKVLGDQEIKKDNILSAAEQTKMQVVLVTRLVGTKEEKIYRPPTYYGVSHSYYNSWGSYYPHMYDYSPGYMETYINVLLETSIFDVKEQQLIWSAASETFAPTDVNKEIKKLAQVLVSKMKKSKIIQ